MIKLGFEIYDISPKIVDLNNDGYFEIKEKEINNEFVLENGDILARDGHIHFYLGDNKNFGWGKVTSKYPQESLTYKDKGNYIICNGETFTRVYRYVGYEE